jgi:hypothetical protein
VLDALPGLGKTTIANTFACEFDRAQRRRLGEVTDDGRQPPAAVRSKPREYQRRCGLG